MSCCSGQTQTRKMSVLVNFRPNNYEQFQLKFELSGRNGRWSGRDTGRFDFGTQISCGGSPPIGVQDVSMKMELNCVEGGPELVVGGFIDIKVAKTTNRFRLQLVVLKCPRGGPGCVAEWPTLFYNQYLGTGSLIVRGVGRQTAD